MRRELLCINLITQPPVQPISGAHQGGRVKTRTKKAIRFASASHVKVLPCAPSRRSRANLETSQTHTHHVLQPLRILLTHIYLKLLCHTFLHYRQRRVSLSLSVFSSVTSLFFFPLLLFLCLFGCRSERLKA